jgi:uncharacterized protein YdeI (YjbR/CyaY-like superfamily)
MSSFNKSIDAYIAESADFAKPILNHLRALIHTACPDVEEKMKWSMPFFDYKGEMMCHMASFKQHCAFGFWKGAIMKDPVLRETAASEAAMGHLGKITSLKDLPSDKKITAWIKEAMTLNDNGIKLPPKEKPAAKETATPDYFAKAIAKNKAAKKVWDGFPPGKKKDYIVWITEAKTEDTRNKRMETAVEWIAEGKGRNWKYEKK